MIDTKSLRIGNYFIEKYSSDLIEVEGIFKNGIIFSNKVYKSEPIEITEELLLKLGFKEEHDRIFSLDHYRLSFKFQRIVDHDHILLIFLDNESIDDRYNEVIYVHQLQNLFYILTGEELTLKT